MGYKIKFKGKDFFGSGVVIYHGKKLLLQKVNGQKYYEDFGGRNDSTDKSVIHAAFRECEEESNGVLNEEFLNNQIKKHKEKCYYMLNNNRYFIYMIYVSRKEKEKLTPEIFGDYENHDGIERKVEWVINNEKLPLHPRLSKIKKN